MMKHTPEPWFYSKSKHGIDASHDVVSCIDNNSDDMSLLIHACGEDFNPQENARRIVACVNFCAGVSTEIIENSRCGEYQQVLLKERDTYREMCAELLNRMRNLEISANSADYCYARNGGNFAYALAQLKAEAEKARELFTKAEQILKTEPQS